MRCRRTPPVSSATSASATPAPSTPSPSLPAAGSDGRALRRQAVGTRPLLLEIPDCIQPVLSPAFGPDGPPLAAAVANGQPRLWELPKAIEPKSPQPEYWAKQDDNAGTHF